jgi:hypothetical protein
MVSRNRPVLLEEVLELARRLSPVDKVRLIEQVAPEIKRDLVAGGGLSGISLLGLVKDLEPAPSAEDIRSARRVAWSNFPRA